MSGEAKTSEAGSSLCRSAAAAASAVHSLTGLCLDVPLWQSVYGLQNDIRAHSPTHTPAPEAKQPTEEELQEQVRPAGGARLIKIRSISNQCFALKL